MPKFEIPVSRPAARARSKPWNRPELRRLDAADAESRWSPIDFFIAS